MTWLLAFPQVSSVPGAPPHQCRYQQLPPAGACVSSLPMMIQLLLKVIVEILSAAGHNVFAAYDGQSACELAEYIPNLDLVISNTRMGAA